MGDRVGRATMEVLGPVIVTMIDLFRPQEGCPIKCKFESFVEIVFVRGAVWYGAWNNDNLAI